MIACNYHVFVPDKIIERIKELLSAEEEDWTCTHGPGDDCAKCAFNLGKKRPGYETHESNHESGDI